jgi:hypothetical protein
MRKTGKNMTKRDKKKNYKKEQKKKFTPKPDKI